MHPRINRRALLPMLALAGLSATVVMAADKPDFSGSWKMNPSKSDFGPLPAPEKLEQTIKHADPKLTFTTSQAGAQGEMTYDTTYMTDGSESVNKFRGMDVKGVAAWDGDKLVIKSKREVQGMEISLVETWSLSADGKVLTIVRNASTPQGDFTLTTVMDKQEGGAAAAPPAASAAVTAPMATGARPDFSGSWKLDVDKSNFGPIPPPTSEIQKIDQKDPVIKVVTTQSAMDGDHTDNLSLTTDGAESKNDFRGNEMKSVAKWDGPSLVVDTKLDFQGTPITMKQIRKLSADGKVMTVNSTFSTPQGDFDMSAVYQKVN